MSKRVTQDDIMYFVVTDRFFGKNKRTVDAPDTSIHGGTLDGIIEKLDYLLELGVTTIWVTPVYENIRSYGKAEPYHYYWPCRFDQIDKRLLDGLDWAIRVTKLCLGALFTMRGIPQLYYGTEVGLEGWKKDGDDCDLRRDFPWHVIGDDNHPKQQFHKERELFEWTRDLTYLRRQNAALKYGTTITLWSDDLVYAFLRIATDDVAFVIINNGYTRMPYPIQLDLNPSVIPLDVVSMIE